MRYVVSVAGVRHTVEVDANGHDRRVTLDGRELTLNWRQIGARGATVASGGAGHYGVLAGLRSYEAYVREARDAAEEGSGARTLEVFVAGHPYPVTVQDARTEALAGIAGSARVAGEATVRAPMPGLVRNVLVSVGDAVERGQVVAVLEAMKMENDLPASRAGIVKAITVTVGQTVNQGDALVSIGEEGAGQEADEEE